MIFPSELSLAFLGLVFLISGLLLWRSAANRQRISRQNPLEELRREHAQQAQTPEAIIHEMEVRLFDYGREVEGRVETTLNVLDRLIIDAEQEISRLEELLQASQQSRTQPGQSTAEKFADRDTPSPELHRIPTLLAAGLTDEEISRCLHCERTLVQQWRQKHFPGNDAAAA